MDDNIYTIGEVANLMNISIKDIRHFENNQLISPSYQGDYNYKLYNEADLEKLKYITQFFKAGFTMDEILDEISDDEV